MNERGRFITFEGGDGSGKSTQAALLEEFLTEKGIQCLRTREPGGSPGAELIRDLILQGDTARWDALTEYLLFSAARRDHLVRTVKPALHEGVWVICDRYIDSSRVYQGIVQGLSEMTLESIYLALSEDLTPDMTLIFDIPVEEGLKRAHRRESLENRFERKGTAFHEKVRAGFLSLAQKNPELYCLFDATLSIEDLHRRVQESVMSKLINPSPVTSASDLSSPLEFIS